jgi:hypothetical protein
MEARKITVVSTKTQKKSVIMSGAETLGELKKDFREAGIDYEGMTFYEGTSKTELKTDESVLPKDVPYTNRTTGETKNTNELVFMLTNTNKKIKSGAMTRTEAYDAIKAKGLQAECQKRFGRNFTMCKTSDLVSLIESTINLPQQEEVKTGCVDVQARAALTMLVDVLNEDYVIGSGVREKIFDILDSAAVTPTVSDGCKSETDSPYDNNEIDDMFSGMC